MTPREDGWWAVKPEGDERASGLYDTQGEAIQAGRELAQNNPSELFIHGRGGRIRDRDSFGGDPFPPRDTRH